MALAPDLIVDVGSTAPTYRDLAARVQSQSGIPTVLLNGRFDATAETFRVLGELLGRPERGEELAVWTEQQIEDIRAGIAKVSPEQRPRVYYARGPAGLETALSGSINIEVLDLLGVINVAGDGLGQGGLASVSMEQLLAWDPEMVLTVDPHFAQQAPRDPLWQQVKAVREGKLYLAPRAPFPGSTSSGTESLDRPPGSRASFTRTFFRLKSLRKRSRVSIGSSIIGNRRRRRYTPCCAPRARPIL